MEQEQIARLNELARAARERTLTAEESAERDALRRSYIDGMKRSLQATLDRTYLVDEQGNKRKLQRRGQ